MQGVGREAARRGRYAARLCRWPGSSSARRCSASRSGGAGGPEATAPDPPAQRSHLAPGTPIACARRRRLRIRSFSALSGRRCASDRRTRARSSSASADPGLPPSLARPRISGFAPLRPAQSRILPPVAPPDRRQRRRKRLPLRSSGRSRRPPPRPPRHAPAVGDAGCRAAARFSAGFRNPAG